ncbi:MAG: hypothetical protein CML42_05635 [Rhodobacteraceae bacterium]|jgi:hypothetical protein|uniref:Uncharacterized protein n=1 Tax=viral metagenome TaxID=1070528 RepID=A0A6C0AKB5_9ZZZZ|nr:hypothetical protein [Paracoccaceae bacterium]|tara:strand:+ start:549 stop:932 length:384 start_codon:yes stop_codon:yes gene_type:complete
MELKLKFFDKEEWSMYGTINVMIPFLLLIVLQQKISYDTLILASIIGMMKGDLIPKIIFTGFLNFLVYEKNIEWIFRSILFVVSTFIIHFIPYNNIVHKTVMNNNILLWIMRSIVLIWMCYIFYLFI